MIWREKPSGEQKQLVVGNTWAWDTIKIIENND